MSRELRRVVIIIIAIRNVKQQFDKIGELVEVVTSIKLNSSVSGHVLLIGQHPREEGLSFPFFLLDTYITKAQIHPAKVKYSYMPHNEIYSNSNLSNLKLVTLPSC